ncbi:hypothetical protein GIB67_025360 [Kingdonia uniflora]|uniref:Uncharacterized protein n=1 Tax=Kingdonia uniflora TaxID=39325 RepID=A0A7J7NBV5_9MAGN|nr:hypothetical protein GIB67_025360 [Kingdonia uniflora]
MEKGLCKSKAEPWRVLEFYSGIGGMRYSIMRADVEATMVEAFDINDKANDVYEHNFGHRPYQGNIQNLTAGELDKYGADAWLLSPPCQPYTRQGLQKHSGDARASSFLNILDLIPHTSRPPLMLFVENVVGFETSDTHKLMLEILEETGYVTQEFILSPLQFGVPYSRPRYFCLAKRKSSSFLNPHVNNKLLWTPGPLLEHSDITWTNNYDQSLERWEKCLQSCAPIESFLEISTLSVSTMLTEALNNKFDGDGSANGYLDQYLVPLSLIERILKEDVDIVYPDSKRCCCFTKSYYRYVKGTGSLLATVQNDKQPVKDNVYSLEKLGLRYFTPREVANLHCLPEDFQFPDHISLKQRYALLGNSLSIAVVAPLLRYLFTDFL